MAIASQLSQGAAALSGIELFREQARRALDPETWHYLEAEAGAGTDAASSAEAWDRLRLRPRVLRGVGEVDVSTTLLGQRLALPVLTAPNGRATRYCPDGELALLEGTEAAGTIALLPSSVAASAGALRARRPKSRFWQQLYIAAARDEMRGLLASLREAGCEAIVLTVDLLPGDGPAPPPPPIAAWEVPSLEPRKAFAATTIDDLAWLCREAGLPVLVKGVLRGDDALRCVEAGAAGLIVSNHGGNQLDTAISSAEALGEIVEACGTRAEVLVDGGIRSGVSVLKALALGARAVLVGRPASYALAAAGGAGVAAMLDGLKSELARTMALCGAASMSSLDPSLVRLVRA